jgi:hypothetical protein
MSIGYHFAENVIIIEFSLVALIVVTTFVLKVYSYFSNKRKKKTIAYIKNYLNKVTLKHQKFKSYDFKSSWRKIDILLQIVDEFDLSNVAHQWLDIRTEFISTIIFPLAKKAALSRQWVSRFYAARAFSLIQEKGNDKLIEKLVNDGVPLINLYAGKAALINHCDPAINSMIKRMASEAWLAESLDLRAFDKIEDTNRDYFDKKLESSQNPDVRAVCYEIMLRYPPAPIKGGILLSDLQSGDVKLKISAIKFISYVDRDAAIPVLVDLLKDPSWLVRLISLHRLSMLNAKQAIPQIVVCLKDSDWWVKISAAEALKNMGEEGERALKSHDLTLDKISFNLTHLLNTWW